MVEVRIPPFHQVMEVGRLVIKRIEGGDRFSIQEELAQTLVRGTYVCCFVGLEVGAGSVVCGASRRKGQLSLGFFIFCFSFVVSLIGMDGAGCAFGCSATGGAEF